jgi:hypothetical protein
MLTKHVNSGSCEKELMIDAEFRNKCEQQKKDLKRRQKEKDKRDGVAVAKADKKPKIKCAHNKCNNIFRPYGRNVFNWKEFCSSRCQFENATIVDAVRNPPEELALFQIRLLQEIKPVEST